MSLDGVAAGKASWATVYRHCQGYALLHVKEWLILAKNLLNNCHYECVCLGRFTTDPLEKEFVKLRQGSGAIYFINVQQITEKIRICKSSLLLSLSVDVEDIENTTLGHSCRSYAMGEKASCVSDNLPQLEESIPDDAKTSLVYIAG